MSKHAHQSHPPSSSASGAPKVISVASVGVFEAGRPCLDLAQQLHAVEKAICAAKRTLIRDISTTSLHRRRKRCRPSSGARLDEFRDIAKYL